MPRKDVEYLRSGNIPQNEKCYYIFNIIFIIRQIIKNIYIAKMTYICWFMNDIV